MLGVGLHTAKGEAVSKMIRYFIGTAIGILKLNQGLSQDPSCPSFGKVVS